MSDFFTPTDKAAIAAFVRNINGLEGEWWTGKTGRFDIIAKDSDGNVIKINLSSMSLSGSVDLTKLPPRLETLYLHSNKLSGHLDLTQPPSSLERLYLDDNSFTTIKIGNLPKSLNELHASNNKLRGVILKPASVPRFAYSRNEDLIVCETEESKEFDRSIAEMTACVRMLRAASSSTHNAHSVGWDVRNVGCGAADDQLHHARCC